MFLLGEVLQESPDDRPSDVQRHRLRARTVFSRSKAVTQVPGKAMARRAGCLRGRASNTCHSEVVLPFLGVFSYVYG